MAILLWLIIDCNLINRIAKLEITVYLPRLKTWNGITHDRNLMIG